jgi:hypothetical protein
MHHLLLPAVFLVFATADAYTAPCSNGTCGGQNIAYPFWLDNLGPNCGYPGFGLFCEENTPILLSQQAQHRYRVLRIDYTNHTVSLADVDVWNTTCPRLIFDLSIELNPYYSSLQLTRSNSNLTLLYNCKSGVSRPSAVKLEGCPEQNTTWYVLPDDGVTVKAYGYGCEAAVTTPVRSSHRLANASRYAAESEQCVACEQSGGRCSYGRRKDDGWLEFACFSVDGDNERQCGMYAPLLICSHNTIRPGICLATLRRVGVLTSTSIRASRVTTQVSHAGRSSLKSHLLNNNLFLISKTSISKTA